MNQTEQQHALRLEALRRAGEIQRWEYEAVTLKLADGCRYTPDFLVIENDGAIRFDETKGEFYRDDARVKLLTAARQFPFKFRLVRKRKGGVWETTEIPR